MMTEALKPPKQMQRTGESSTDTSNLIFPVELRSNTFEEFDTIISLWLIPDESTKKFLLPVIIHKESFLRKPTQAVCRVSGKARDGYQSGVVRIQSSVQFVPLFKFRSFTTIINIMSPSMEPYRMSRRIDLRPRPWDIAQIFQIF